MSNKTIAISTAIVISMVTIGTLLAESYTTLQSINPVAVLAATTVAVIGLAWFKKVNKS